ncbi:MAG: HAMP domain-containing histidine kinase [Planctomycetes bacterium]|jgi:signal transduction histidine kinase|nr:HAMP domain-containing histidine kinase [Planctomycetota bacterium]
MRLFYRLSDRILLVFIIFATALIITVHFFIGDSIGSVLALVSVVYVVTFTAVYAMSRSFSKHINTLTFKVEEMAAGNLSRKLKSIGQDEVGQLTNALNELLSRLKSGVAIDVSKHRELAQAKTDFIALASHQLRTPLSIIKWYVDFLICGDAGPLSQEQDRYLREVYRSNERLIELVNALLDVSRIDVGTFSIEPEPTDIIERAERALERYQAEFAAKKIKLEKIYDTLPPINLDPRLTKIVFENIISNAVKYTPEGGIIRLSVKKTESNVLIKISDSGCGIPREQQPQIFTKLFRADNVKKIESIGTGLGLYIVKAVIEKSGGKIWFESPSLELLLEKGQSKADIPLDKRNLGTTFFITIPLKGMKRRAGTKKLSSL